MKGFYNITTKIKETLALDAFVNTVTYGDIFEVDLNKQDIFPLSHFKLNCQAEPKYVALFTIKCDKGNMSCLFRSTSNISP